MSKAGFIFVLLSTLYELRVFNASLLSGQLLAKSQVFKNDALFAPEYELKQP
jgi:hypothetical protein